MYPINHRILDAIDRILVGSVATYWELRREGDCLEFTDPTNGRHYAIVVTPIDERSDTCEDGEMEESVPREESDDAVH